MAMPFLGALKGTTVSRDQPKAAGSDTSLSAIQVAVDTDRPARPSNLNTFLTALFDPEVFLKHLFARERRPPIHAPCRSVFLRLARPNLEAPVRRGYGTRPIVVALNHRSEAGHEA
jgi:hypothetical protein